MAQAISVIRNWFLLSIVKYNCTVAVVTLCDTYINVGFLKHGVLVHGSVNGISIVWVYFCCTGAVGTIFARHCSWYLSRFYLGYRVLCTLLLIRNCHGTLRLSLLKKLMINWHLGLTTSTLLIIVAPERLPNRLLGSSVLTHPITLVVLEHCGPDTFRLCSWTSG